MRNVPTYARWLVVLVVSFAGLVTVMTAGDGALSMRVTSQALIGAYALAGAYLLYEFFGRGRRPVASDTPGE